MTEAQIKAKVLSVLDNKELIEKLNIDRRKAYELRNRGQSVSKMLELLWKADQLKFK